MKKLFISNEAISKYGFGHFKNFNYDALVRMADDDFKELEDGLLIIKDDNDILIQATEADDKFNDIEDIRYEIELIYHSQFFNMKSICEYTGIKYQTYRNWKNNNQSFGNDKIKKLLNAMIDVSKEIENSIIDMNPMTLETNEHIVIGNRYRFSELWNGDGDGEELLDSGSIALWSERVNDEAIIEFSVIEKDENDILNTLVKVIDIS